MRFSGFEIVFIIALIGAAMASCASMAQKVSANTEVKLEKVYAENPLSQTIILAKELVGATIGAPSEGRDSDLMLIVKMYLKNNNSFDLDLMRVSYTLTLDGEIVATGAREGKQGELAIKSGEEKTIDLPLRVFTRQAIGHAMAGLVKKGAKLTLKGTLKFQTVMGAVTFPYSVENIL